MAAYRSVRHLWLVSVLAALPAFSPAHGGSALIYVTNSAGDNIHVIDPATNKVVQEIKGVEAAHGIVAAPDGSRVYVSNEADTTLDVFDRASGALVKKVPLSNRPNNIAVTKNGDRILVGIARGHGAVDVIDAKTLTLSKSILVNGRLHNIYVTPDGKHLITGSIPNKLLTVIDLEREVPVWELSFDLGVRPMTIEAGPDGEHLTEVALGDALPLFGDAEPHGLGARHARERGRGGKRRRTRHLAQGRDRIQSDDQAPQTCVSVRLRLTARVGLRGSALSTAPCRDSVRLRLTARCACTQPPASARRSTDARSSA